MNDVEGYRLLPVQRRTWTRMNSGEHRVLTARIRLAAELDLIRLHSAIVTLTARHEALRLRLVEHPGLRVPLQVVDPAQVVGTGPTDGALSGSLASVFATGTELVISASELIVDPASLRVLLLELARAYAGQPWPDAEDRLQFLDVSEWRLDQAEQAHLPAPAMPSRAFALPFPPPTAGSGVGTCRATVSREQSTALRQAAVIHQCEVDELLFAAWALALTAYLEDGAALPVAWHCAGRQAAGTDEVVGPLTYPIPVGVGKDWTIEDALAALREAERHLPSSTPPDDLAVGFAAVSLTVSSELSALHAIDVVIDYPHPAEALHLEATISADELRLAMRFDTAQYEEASVDRLLDRVLAAIPAASGPDGASPIGDAELAVLSSWSNTDPRWPPTTLTALLDSGIRQAKTTAAAVIADDGTLTFQELDATATAIARQLGTLGVGAEAPVVVIAERSWCTVAAFVGILRAGAVYVPVDPTWPLQSTQHLARAVGARAILASRAGLLEPLAGEFPSKVIRRSNDEPPAAADVSPQQAAYIIFTSGSTGTPRAVVVEQGAAANLTQALAETVYSGESAGLRVAVNAPFAFDASIKQLIQLAAGHTLCVLPDNVRQDGDAMLNHLAHQQVDVLDCTPSHLRIILAGTGGGGRLPRLLLVGGESIDPALWETLATLDGTRSVNLYGPTECTVDVTSADIVPGRVPVIGRPLPGTQVWVLDDQQQPVPAGVAGELCVSGVQLARGYHNDDNATANQFVRTRLPNGRVERVYRTGDKVKFLADGNLAYLGRLDSQVKIRGVRIEPGEVESALCTHPGVERAVVVARNDDGHGDRLIGYVQPAVATQLDLATVEGVNPHETRYLHDEIFVQATYLRGGVVLRKGAVVFDVGANIGMFSLFVHSQCPTASVYAFEPLPTVAGKLARNVARHHVSAQVFPFGLSEIDQEVPFTYYPGYSMMSGQSAYADAAAEVEVIKRYLANERDSGIASGGELLAHADELLVDRFRSIEQQCRLRRLSGVIDEIGVSTIDLLKIDVQRAEFDVLRGLDYHHWPLIQQIAMEVHDAAGTVTEGRVDDVADLLTEHGFQVTIEQDGSLVGTDRFTVYAVRPGYADEARNVPNMPVSGTVDGQALRDWLIAWIPSHLVPDTIVTLNEIPLTDNGKIDRATLPAPTAAHTAGDRVPPENAIEEVLMEIWRDILGVDQVGVTDNFFSLGGDSIRSIRVQAAATRRGLEFPLRSIFTHQTIRALVHSQEISMTETEQSATADAFALINERDRNLLPDGLDDAYPMSVLQVGMVYHSELTGNPATYHNVTTHRLTAPLNPDALRAAIATTVAEHPILRTGFDIGRYDEPLQLVAHTVEVPLTVEDLQDLDDHTQYVRIRAAIDAELAHPFDFAQPPLVRFRAFHIGPETFELLVSEYHAILDGWSLQLLLGEIVQRYDQLLHGRVDELLLTQPISPFRRFVELERAARVDATSQRFWRERLSGTVPLHLGRMSSDPVCTNRVHLQPLHPEIPTRLEQVGAEFAVPLKALLLAVHMRALGEETNRDDVLTGLVTSTRTGENSGDRTLGLFLNTVPLRMSLGNASLAELAHDAWRAEQQIMGHHLVPLADVEHALGRGRLFDTFFNFTRFDKIDIGSGHAHIAPSLTIPVDVGFSLAVDFEREPHSGELRLTLTYADATVAPEQVVHLGERYRRLLSHLCGDGDAPLPVLGGDERGVEDTWTVRLARLWRDILGVSPSSTATDFFEAGGHSLLALRFVSALRVRYGVSLDLANFTQDARLATLVAQCAAADSDG